MVEDNRGTNLVQKWWNGEYDVKRWLNPLIFVAVGLLLASIVSGPNSTVFKTVEQGAPSLSGGWSCIVTMNDVGNHFDQSCDAITPTATPSPSVTPTMTPSPSPSPTVTPTQTPSPTPPPTTTNPPTPSPTPSPTGNPTGCPVTGKNKPGAADPWGGCFPGPSNVGVPNGTVLTNYTGSCTITVNNTVIDHKLVTCATLDIRATGVQISFSMLQGTDVTDSASSTAGFSIVDSTVQNGARDQCLCIGDHNFTALRVNVVGGNRSMYCAKNCTIQDSWLHGQILQGAQHGSGLREEQFTTATHNTFECSYPNVNDSTTLGCSAPQNGYADFAPIHDNTNSNNLYVSTTQGNCATCSPGRPNSSYCSYGGNSGGKPFSNDPTNGTFIKYLNNVFQKGSSGICGDFETIGDYSKTKTGNVATGNIYDDGTAVPSSQIG